MILTIKQLKLAKADAKGEEKIDRNTQRCPAIPLSPPPPSFLLAIPKHRLARENASQTLLDTTFLLFFPSGFFFSFFRPCSFLFCFHSLLHIHARVFRAARFFPSPPPSSF